MSYEALNWAGRQPTHSAPARLVLVALAHFANGKTGEAYPSVAEIAQFTRLGRRTIFRQLQGLQRASLIEDSGRRVGRTGQIVVWKLRLAEAQLPLDIPPRKSANIRHPLESANGATMEAPLKSATQGIPVPIGKGAKKAPKGCHSYDTRNLRNNNSPNGEYGHELELGLESAKSEPTKPTNPAAQVFAAWNVMASLHGLPVASKLTPDRRKKLNARLKEHGAAAILGAIASVPNSPFLMGKSGNGSWRGADFNFILTAAHMNRLIEGGYSDGQASDVPLYQLLNRERGYS